ncbi:hypothetical protein Sjap_024057 [Stephania japonica]|uniref:Uncharacterized protein n=1 Tax=Stephania japonica TaxID=461633 RepID=A0AAP0ECR8_9MAGN
MLLLERFCGKAISVQYALKKAHQLLIPMVGYRLARWTDKSEGKNKSCDREITYVSASKPIDVDFFLLSPATGSVYWTQKHPGDFTSVFSESDLHYFTLDERIFLAFVAAQKLGSPLLCRTIRKVGDLVREREGIQRKLSTTYSLGRDRTKSSLPSILPFSDGYSSSWSSQGESSLYYHGDEELEAKGKAPAEPGPSSAPVMSKKNTGRVLWSILQIHKDLKNRYSMRQLQGN